MREKRKCGGGKRKLWILAFVILFVASCAQNQNLKQPEDPFSYNAYGAIATAVANLDLIDSIFTSLRAQREVSDEAWAKYDVFYKKSAGAIADAANAMADYKRGKGTEAAAKLILKKLDEAMADLQKDYEAKIPADKRKPLIR